ncbi:hypothetical protein R3X25_02275 [Lutibacter sp. TH_r2]|uniref:hypothetical protein n=1 Tax=Lutibacter sp. TH_r2 TaxID=3082083 RepID=UPI0029559C15|nr:hypothetical protein [Lutibacter sp. TH_r2]MDV7186095.1 hypothetical protein [Lutibacter sp. TH_r2]
MKFTVALIYVTYCSEIYSSTFDKKLFKSELFTDDDDVDLRVINGFHKDDEKTYVLNSSLNKIGPKDINGNSIFLFHDSLDPNEISKEIIDSFSQFNKLLLVKHINNSNGLNDFLESEINKNKPKTFKTCSKSHLQNSTNIFYRLNEFWGENVNFDEKLNEFESKFFSSDEEISNRESLNQKLTFLHKLLGGEFDEEEANRFGFEKSYFNENEISKSLTAIADKLLN